MTLVTMEGPVTLFIRHKLHLTHLAYSNVRGHLGPASSPWHGAAIRAGHGEFMTMNMDGMIGHCQIAHTYPDPVVLAYIQGINAGENAAVPGPQIKFRHGHDVGLECTGLYVISTEQENKIPVHFINLRMFIFRMSNP